MLIPLGFWAASSGGAAGSFDLLETQVLSSSAASVIFSSLSTYAADYQHLQIRYVANSTTTGDFDTASYIRFNGDTGNNYATHWLRGTGSSVTSSASTSTSVMWGGWVNSSKTSTNYFSAHVVDILDPFSSSKNTTIRALNGVPQAFGVALTSGFWNNTNSLTQITISLAAGDFRTGSRFSLYGIKAA